MTRARGSPKMATTVRLGVKSGNRYASRSPRRGGHGESMHELQPSVGGPHVGVARKASMCAEACSSRGDRAFIGVIRVKAVAVTVAVTVVAAVAAHGVSSRNTQSAGRDEESARVTELPASRPGLVFVRTPRTVTVNASSAQAAETGRWTGRWAHGSTTGAPLGRHA